MGMMPDAERHRISRCAPIAVIFSFPGMGFALLWVGARLFPNEIGSLLRAGPPSDAQAIVFTLAAIESVVGLPALLVALVCFGITLFKEKVPNPLKLLLAVLVILSGMGFVWVLSGLR